jgi:hypothetical protein
MEDARFVVNVAEGLLNPTTETSIVVKMDQIEHVVFEDAAASAPG